MQDVSLRLTNRRMLEAINTAAEASDTEILKQINFVMTVNAYEALSNPGATNLLKEKKQDRRKSDRKNRGPQKIRKTLTAANVMFLTRFWIGILIIMCYNTDIK